MNKWASLNFWHLSRQETWMTLMWRLPLDLWNLNVILKGIQDSLQQSLPNPVYSAWDRSQILCCAFAVSLYMKRYVISFIKLQIPPGSFSERYFGLLYNPQSTRTMLRRHWLMKMFHTWSILGTHKYLLNEQMMTEEEALFYICIFFFNCTNFVVL